MAKNHVSISVIKRLPRYYRFFSDLLDNNFVRISSAELAERMGLTASQIRQDLNCFGGFGLQGYGYNVAHLKKEIGDILGLNCHFKAIIIGSGNLGKAIATHMSFEKRGFNLVGVFDNKESIIGQMIKGLPIRNVTGLDEFCNENHPDVAILCLPKEQAPVIVEQLVTLGIKGIWNFSHYDITMKYPDLAVENVHLSDSLMTFCYKVKQDNVK